MIRSSSSLAAVLSVSSLFVALSVTSAACSSSSSDTGFSSDSGAAKTCAGEGFSCTAVSACAASLGHLVGDPTAAASCGGSSSVCCSLGATSCGGAETFSCAMGSQTARPVCTGGFLQCATGYSQVDAPSADGGSTTNACTTVGGTCTSVSACSSGGVIVGDDGAAAACGSTADSVCCTTTCNGDPGMVCVVTEDGGDSETLNQECVMGQLTCPAGVATAADAGH